MLETIGDFDEDYNNFVAKMNVTFYPEDFPIKWSHCTLSAEFLADYYSYYFPSENVLKQYLVEREEMKTIISYILNELIENAVKYRYSGNIQVCMGFYGKELIFLVTNDIHKQNVPNFQGWLNQLCSEEPGELLYRKVEENAANQSSASGLGLLIIMSDYGAKLGWSFQSKGALDSVEVNTMARLPIRKEFEKMEVKDSDYRVWFDATTGTVFFEGSLRLNGVKEYEPIATLLTDVLDKNPAEIILDMRELEFLNSSGINILYQFVISVRKKVEVKLIVRGSKKIPWQGKSLPNMQKFLKTLQLLLD